MAAEEAKSSAAASAEAEDRELLLSVARFFQRKRDENALYGGDAEGGLETIFEDWVDSHCEDVEDEEKEDSSDGTGHSHSLRALWQGYCEEFEKSCNWAIEVEGGDPKAFFAACEAATRRGGLARLQEAEPDSALSWFLESVFAALDFESFLEMLRVKKDRALKTRKEDHK